MIRPETEAERGTLEVSFEGDKPLDARHSMGDGLTGDQPNEETGDDET